MWACCSPRSGGWCGSTGCEARGPSPVSVYKSRVTARTTPAAAPVIDSRLAQSTRTLVSVIRSRTAPSVRPTAEASSRPSAIGIAVCHSTDRLSVRRRVPKATSADSSFLRSRNCSSWETSRLHPISSRTHTAPTNRPVRMEAKRSSRSVADQSAGNTRGPRAAAVLRTRSRASGTEASRPMYARPVIAGRAASGSAFGVIRKPPRSRPLRSWCESTLRMPSGTFQATS